MRFFDVSDELTSSLCAKLEGAARLNGFNSAAAFLAATDPRLDLVLMFELQQLLVANLQLEAFPAVQFPANLRLMPAPRPAQGSFATEQVHADFWSGAPRDSENFLIYLRSDKGSPSTAFYRDPENFTAGYRGPYQSAPLRRDSLRLIGTLNSARSAAHFSTLTLHQTLPGVVHGALRISMDFRVRTTSCYLSPDGEPLQLAEFQDNGSGNPGLGHYWTQQPRAMSLKEMIHSELDFARSLGQWALDLRVNFLKSSRFFKGFQL